MLLLFSRSVVHMGAYDLFPSRAWPWLGPASSILFWNVFTTTLFPPWPPLRLFMRASRAPLAHTKFAAPTTGFDSRAFFCFPLFFSLGSLTNGRSLFLTLDRRPLVFHLGVLKIDRRSSLQWLPLPSRSPSVFFLEAFFRTRTPPWCCHTGFFLVSLIPLSLPLASEKSVSSSRTISPPGSCFLFPGFQFFKFSS